MNRSAEIIIRNVGKVRTFEINRAADRNSLTPSLLSRLHELLIEYERDDDALSAVLFGSKGNFSQGTDPDPEAADVLSQHSLFDYFCTKPITAAVSGYAVNVGFDLALWCDFRVVDETAVFGWTDGNPPLSDKAAARLSAVVPMSRLFDWRLTGRQVYAKEAFDAGIVNRLVATGCALGQGVNFGASLAHRPLQSVVRADRVALTDLHRKFQSEESQSVILNEKEKMRHLAKEELRKHFTMKQGN